MSRSRLRRLEAYVNTITSAFTSGIRRVNAAPAVLAGMLVVTFLAALPLGLTLRQMIADNLGAGAAARGQASAAWLQQFTDQATGVGRAFSPSTFGFAAVLDNLSSILDNRAAVLPVVITAVGYALVWIFLGGGILDRYARNRPTRAYGFFAACGGYFFRLLRLSIVAGLIYSVLFAYVHPLIFGTAWQNLTVDYTSESKAFALRMLLYALFAGLLCLVNLVFDYSRVRIVVEDRRSALAAIAAAVRFARRQPRVFALYLLDGGCYLLVVAIYWLVAPGLNLPTWWTLLVGQTYVLARLWVKLLFYASAIAFFQGALAHADYIATPLPAWPDSPSADAIIHS